MPRAFGRLNTVRSTRSVHLRYEVAALPTGSMLRLYNDPEDESFSVGVSATLATDVGSGSTDATACRSAPRRLQASSSLHRLEP